MRFTKITGGETVFSDTENNTGVLQDCFQFCEPDVQSQVADFLDSARQKLTLNINQSEYILERIEENDNGKNIKTD